MNQSQLEQSTQLIKEFVASKQTQLFHDLKKSQFTGELWFQSSQQAWVFYFYLGRVLYATGGVHPLRRLRRHVYLFFSEHIPHLMEQISSAIAKPINVCWEYDLLCSWLDEDLTNREKLIKMIKTQIAEILFDLTQVKQITYHLKPKKLNPTKSVLIDPNQVVVEAWKKWQDWQGAQIADRSPNSAPIVTQQEQLRLCTSAKTYQALNQLLKDKLTLRELAIQTEQDILQLTRLLIPCIQQGLIELRDIPDLVIPNPKKVVKSDNPLIVSIFNHDLFRQYLDPLLKESGYYYLNLDDGLDSRNHLISLKPDLMLVEWQIIKNSGPQGIIDWQLLQGLMKISVIVFVQKLGFLEEIQAKTTGCGQVVSLSINKDSFLNLMKQHLR
ncbi:DUF4388 domain-containing protein [Gloeocapsa sp. PCC 73106]|uniref:DUF4388 domain-containing protein n=1 Tax=Gloeocapsa sp. PCC 73106 TaxID=102232 RepID=UPI0002ACD279|nr:DUF4388 domain-containing protein [Gloeocapsa sp. PCC 73106]ELR99555.1 hypothetical protein GLO73106DRAFT_00034070 [Gloeocapsa sp. PCC 73106]